MDILQSILDIRDTSKENAKTVSNFHTLRISDPRFERDYLRHLTVKSAALQGRGDIVLFVPPGLNAASPVVTLLHGVYGSCWSWALGGGVHLTALKLMQAGSIPPMLIAMPSDGLWGDGSGYLPHATQNFERWIAEEVPLALAETRTVAPEAPRFIGGLSMGGFGALRLGAKYFDRYKGISGHSSITHFDQLAQFVEEPLDRFESNPANHAVADTMLVTGSRMPALRFDCGQNDPLLDANRSLHATLLGAGIPHVYEEFSGGHSWPYWEEHVVQTLRFFASISSSLT